MEYQEHIIRLVDLATLVPVLNRYKLLTLTENSILTDYITVVMAPQERCQRLTQFMEMKNTSCFYKHCKKKSSILVTISCISYCRPLLLLLAAHNKVSIRPYTALTVTACTVYKWLLNVFIVSAARSLTCRDDLDSKWRLLLAENELSRVSLLSRISIEN